jgi:hypothetical protein
MKAARLAMRPGFYPTRLTNTSNTNGRTVVFFVFIVYKSHTYGVLSDEVRGSIRLALSREKLAFKKGI